MKAGYYDSRIYMHGIDGTSACTGCSQIISLGVACYYLSADGGRSLIYILYLCTNSLLLCCVGVLWHVPSLRSCSYKRPALNVVFIFCFIVLMS